MVMHEKGEHASNVSHRLRSLSRPVAPTMGIPGANREFPTTARVETEELRSQVKVRWNMVFTWQAPIMLMSYSVVFFLLGLTIFVITPLYDGRNFDGESRVSGHFRAHPFQCDCRTSLTLFWGQGRNILRCLSCNWRSHIYVVFILVLPIC